MSDEAATLPWRQLRDEAIATLTAAGVEDPAQEVRWITEQATGRTAAEQVLALDEPATQREVAHVDRMVARRAAGEPLQYVLGRWGFRTLDLLVDGRVLIPRPETEVVAGLAVEAIRELGRSGRAADLGTGSGAIALSLAAECWPHVEVLATDASAEALAVARANLAGLGRRASVVRLLAGDWFDALPEGDRGRLDVIVANPPYVAEGDELPVEVSDWEPTAALRSGADGLDDLRRIIAGAPRWLAPDGVLIVEIGDSQGAAVLSLAAAAGLVDGRIEQDLAGRDRALVARRPSVAPADEAHARAEAPAPLVISRDSPKVVERVVAALRDGGAVVLPTDTVYGLAALPTDADATERLFTLKGRAEGVPMAVLCADAEQALSLADPAVDPAVLAVAALWWPGPLTLVLPRRAGRVLHVGEPAATIGVRVPDDDLVRQVAALTGPIAVTSANRHGHPTPPTAHEVLAALGPGVSLVVDGGPLEASASTVVDCTSRPWRALREGTIPAGEILGLAEPG